ncbi:MAG: hypothetical protein H6729_04290 [Deltaproteobacteria bacterium]|nr:hypothetical protein [Deltaproteobacteria bacterium]
MLALVPLVLALALVLELLVPLVLALALVLVLLVLVLVLVSVSVLEQPLVRRAQTGSMPLDRRVARRLQPTSTGCIRSRRH